MCAIIFLRPKQMIPYEMLKNCCHNNWHSYGLVTRVDGRLDIKKKVPESGEVDPDEVFKLLQDDIEYERYLHLRHNTAGATTEENTHPFEVYYSKKRHVVFMHNGTIHDFKSKKTVNGVVCDDNDGPSDTKNFVDQILTPYIAAMDFGNGKGDIQHPLFKKMISKFWPLLNNRGLLISNDQDPLFLSAPDWKMVGPEGEKFCASNDDYFDKVIRGPEFSRREAAEAEKRKKNQVDKPKGTVGLSDLKDFNFNQTHGFYNLSESLVNILNDWEFYDRETAVSLGYASRDELLELYMSKKDCITVMEWIFTDYAKMFEELEEAESKHAKASKKIAELVEELRAERGENRKSA